MFYQGTALLWKFYFQEQSGSTRTCQDKLEEPPYGPK